MANFTIGLSALRTSQFAMDIVSNNVANSQTEGYHRRTVNMKSVPPNLIGGFRIGNGVGISQINRVRDSVTEASLTTVIADSNHVGQMLTVERNIESAITAGENAIGRQLDAFFSEFTNLSASPSDPALRSSLIESGVQLSSSLRDASNKLDELKQNVRQQIDAELESLNMDLQELSDVSTEIFRYSAQGIDHNIELDQRDAIINRIAEVIGIFRHEKAGGQLHVTIGNHSIQQGNKANVVSAVDVEGKVEIRLDNSDRALPLETGRLGALIQAYNELIPSYQDHLNQVSAQLIQKVNSVQSTGIGTAGSFETLIGNTSLSDVNVPLAEALPDLDLSAGEITIAVTDPSGNRETQTLTFDPATDSLTDLVGRFNTVPGVNASIRANSNQLQITSAPGYTFDFTGGMENQPDLSLITGSSVPALSGHYTGQANEELTVRIEGSGTIGNSGNLFANVFSSSGALLQRVSLGTGYEPGSEIELDDGVRLSFAAGTLNNNDEFTTRVTGDPDETGTLAALGVNAFFQGSDARTIRVDSSIVSDPERISTGRTGEPSDASNLNRFIGIGSDSSMPRGRTLTQYVSEFTTELGFEIQSNTALNTSLTNYKMRLEQERDSKSGVDLNEELVYLQEYQKSYEAAVRVIQVTDQMLNELINIFK